MNDSRSVLPIVAGGILLAALLIYIGGGGQRGPNVALIQEFVERPPVPGAPTPEPFTLPQVSLPELAPEVQRAVTGVRDQLAGGFAAPALTPVATSPRARVEVAEVRREGEKLRVRGGVANTAGQALEIPPGAFSFRDSAGTSYATAGSGGATLQPGESTTFDLTVPLPEGRGLTLILTLPPDPPLEQILVLEVAP